MDSVVIDMNPPMFNTLDYGDVKCFGDSDAWAKIAVSGGTPPLTYIWNTGDITDSIGNLPISTYTVTVTDFYKCQTIDSVTIIQPNLLTERPCKSS